MTDVLDALKAQRRVDEQLEDIFMEAFELKGDKHKDNPGYMAWAGFAVPVAVSLCNIFLSLKDSNSGRNFRALSDVVYNLAGNEFWVKNYNVLNPMLTAAMNSYKDYAAMAVERIQYQEYANYDKLMSGSLVAPLEIFSLMLYLVGGPLLMAGFRS